MKQIHSCVSPKGKFIYGIHKPEYRVDNFRTTKQVRQLGSLEDNSVITNDENYPDGQIEVTGADWIFEIRNPFSFRGATFIDKEWADASANNHQKIRIAERQELSLNSLFDQEGTDKSLISKLPSQLLLTLATCSTDPQDLIILANKSAEIIMDMHGQPIGLKYSKNNKGAITPVITDYLLYEAVANSSYLPDAYKEVMVLRPGAQGKSEIVGEINGPEDTHIYEYLRRNSYIAGGHYAANMADNAVRYNINSLTGDDILGLRHLYYQRTFTKLAKLLDIPVPSTQAELSAAMLEELRISILQKLKKVTPELTATLWGWNFGFDYAPTKYRLHASHQQIHQQYAMLPDTVDGYNDGTKNIIDTLPSFGCGDLIHKVIEDYKKLNNSDFFTDYLASIHSNKRMDDREDLDDSLIIWQDENVILFVPKAQTSQWELQLMTIPSQEGSLVGNILEADANTRNSLNSGILFAQKALAGLGAEMVTSIEYPKRINSSQDYTQPLIYCFLPRLPESPGAFSEAQLRYINGHYPEDFAAVCRVSLKNQEIL